MGGRRRGRYDAQSGGRSPCTFINFNVRKRQRGGLWAQGGERRRDVAQSVARSYVTELSTL